MPAIKVKSTGFTLVELITVIIVLGVVSVGLSGFIRTGMSIYSDVTDRDQLLAESRFLVERLSRELRQAIPNSARVEISGNTQCLEFVPALWTTYYTSLPVFPDNSTQATVVEIGLNEADYQITYPSTGVLGDYAFVYPTSSSDIYDTGSAKRQEILACTDVDNDCHSPDDPDHTAVLTLSGSFADESPASRLYFGRQATSYCAEPNGEIRRYQNDIGQVQGVYTLTGVLMAEGLSNPSPFKVEEASLTRNGLINLTLEFGRNDELVNYNVEVHIPNVP